jgi:hypothetical protein
MTAQTLIISLAVALTLSCSIEDCKSSGKSDDESRKRYNAKVYAVPRAYFPTDAGQFYVNEKSVKRIAHIELMRRNYEEGRDTCLFNVIDTAEGKKANDIKKWIKSAKTPFYEAIEEEIFEKEGYSFVGYYNSDSTYFMNYIYVGERK